MPKVTVQIDPSACILAATCVGIEPKLFQIDQESHVELTDATGIPQGTAYAFEATETELKLIEEAVDSCPTGAISMQAGV
jgi:ferredoxin